MLDDQQMRCITKEVRNHLVLAGAGTGKTTTIVGYVKYLLKRKICMPDEILVLSFTNASAAEMSERLQKEMGRPITAQTFHKLGLDIITAAQGKKPKIYSADIRQFVRKQLDTLTQDPAYLRKLCEYLTYNGAEQKTEFDFQTEEEYRSYLQYNPPVTLKKETVKSYGELDIANFLTQNGITYVYEQEYPVDTRTSQFGQYRPDFYLPNFDLYIEYFGINRQGEVPPYFSGKDGLSATQAYQEGIAWKRELHRKNGTRMIELYAYEKLEEQLLTKLEERLKKAGVVYVPMSPQEMWAEISGTQNQKLDRVAELFGTVITLTKNNDCSLEEVHGRNRSLKNLPSIDAVIDMIEPIYSSYQSMLHERNEIDFNDMINMASAYVQSGQYGHPYRYVIVDEYQDISQARYRLLEAMRQQKDYGDVEKVVWKGFRKPLDEYFNLRFANPSEAKKPTQNMPNQISEIIEYLGSSISPEKIRFAHYLMDLASDAREELADKIEYAFRRQRELKRAVPLAAFGEIKCCAFISMPGIIQYPIQEQIDYAYAAASRNEKIPVMWISLEYDDKNKLASAEGKKCFFSDLKGDDIERIRRIGCVKAQDWVLQYKMVHGKIGRNDYCPCGSGKKYKFCCIEIQ